MVEYLKKKYHNCFLPFCISFFVSVIINWKYFEKIKIIDCCSYDVFRWYRQSKFESSKSKDYEIVFSFAKYLVSYLIFVFYLVLDNFNLIEFKVTRNSSRRVYTVIKKLVLNLDEAPFFDYYARIFNQFNDFKQYQYHNCSIFKALGLWISSLWHELVICQRPRTFNELSQLFAITSSWSHSIHRLVSHDLVCWICSC